MSSNKSLTFISHLVVFIVFICLCGLGSWQTQRYLFKTEREQQIAQKQGEISFNIKEVIEYPEDIRDLPVQLSGKTEPERVFLLDNRQHDGQVGYEVIAPVVTNYGTVLVNFGWIKAPEFRSELPDVELPSFLADEKAMVTIPGKNRFVSETATSDGLFPKVIQEVDFLRLAEFAQLDVVPFMLTLVGDDAVFVRRWQPVVMPAIKHIGYALQWFGLAIALLVIYWRLARKRSV